jgi:hypothetical protein
MVVGRKEGRKEGSPSSFFDRECRRGACTASPRSKQTGGGGTIVGRVVGRKEGRSVGRKDCRIVGLQEGRIVGRKDCGKEGL